MVVMRKSVRARMNRRVRQRPSQRHVFQPRRFLLTRNEAAFCQVLMAVVGDRYLVSCKVRLADIITCSERDWRRGHANRIAQKHVDFVLTHVTSSQIVAAVELDDRSHLRPERRLRDVFLNDLFRRMRVRLIRIPASWHYDRATLTDFLVSAGMNVSAKSAAGLSLPSSSMTRREY